MPVIFHTQKLISVDHFIDVLNRSTLGERRPVQDRERIDRMLDHANLIITAWDGDLLVGVARSITDFSYCCYLSDLAVDIKYQKQGIGKKLIDLTHEMAGKCCALILLSAPAAMDYYPRIGMEKIENGFQIRRSE